MTVTSRRFLTILFSTLPFAALTGGCDDGEAMTSSRSHGAPGDMGARHQGPPPSPPAAGHVVHRAMDRLDLAPGQGDALAALARDDHRRHQAIREAHDGVRLAMAEVFSADAFDGAPLDAPLSELEAALLARGAGDLAVLQGLHGTLGSAQRAELIESLPPPHPPSRHSPPTPPPGGHQEPLPPPPGPHGAGGSPPGLHGLLPMLELTGAQRAALQAARPDPPADAPRPPTGHPLEGFDGDDWDAAQTGIDEHLAFIASHADDRIRQEAETLFDILDANQRARVVELLQSPLPPPHRGRPPGPPPPP